VKRRGNKVGRRHKQRHPNEEKSKQKREGVEKGQKGDPKKARGE